MVFVNSTLINELVVVGFVPTENLRFREDALTFKVSERADEIVVG